MSEAKLLRRLCAAVLGLIALAAALYIVPGAREEFPGEEQSGAAHPVTGQPVVTNITGVGAVAVRNSAGSCGIMIENGVPALIPVKKAQISDKKLADYVVRFANLPAQRDLGAQADYSQFGLDKPSAVVTLLTADGETRLLLGGECPVGGGYYLKREDGARVYVVDTETARLMRRSADDFRDFDLFPGLDRAGMMNLDTIEIKNQKTAFALARIRDVTSAALFRLDYPFVSPLNWQLVDELIVAPLSRLEPRAFVSDEAPLSAYGLDAPEIKLTLRCAGRTIEAGFASAEGGGYYCADLSTSAVYLCAAESAEFLSRGYMELFNDTVYNGNIAETENITVLYGGRRYSVDIEGWGEDLSGRSDGGRLAYADISALFSRLTAIPITEEASAAGADLGADLAIVITRRDKRVDTIEFAPIGGRRSAVILNGFVRFSTFSSVVSDIKNYVDRVLQN